MALCRAFRSGCERVGSRVASVPAGPAGLAGPLATALRQRPVLRARVRHRVLRQPGRRAATVQPELLALLEVVDLEDLRLARKLNPGFGQHRHELLAERLELLPRVPDLAHPEVPFRAEADVVIEPLGRKLHSGLFKRAGAFVVLLGGQRRGAKADYDAHGKSSRLGVGPTLDERLGQRAPRLAKLEQGPATDALDLERITADRADHGRALTERLDGRPLAGNHEPSCL